MSLTQLVSIRLLSWSWWMTLQVIFARATLILTQSKLCVPLIVQRWSLAKHRNSFPQSLRRQVLNEGWLLLHAQYSQGLDLLVVWFWLALCSDTASVSWSVLVFIISSCFLDDIYQSFNWSVQNSFPALSLYCTLTHAFVICKNEIVKCFFFFLFVGGLDSFRFTWLLGVHF